MLPAAGEQSEDSSLAPGRPQDARSTALESCAVGAALRGRRAFWPGQACASAWSGYGTLWRPTMLRRDLAEAEWACVEESLRQKLRIWKSKAEKLRISFAQK
jgi:hypothetical protein